MVYHLLNIKAFDSVTGDSLGSTEVYQCINGHEVEGYKLADGSDFVFEEDMTYEMPMITSNVTKPWTEK